MDSRLCRRGGGGGGSSVLRACIYFGTRSFCEHMNLVSQVCRLTGNGESVGVSFWLYIGNEGMLYGYVVWKCSLLEAQRGKRPVGSKVGSYRSRVMIIAVDVAYTYRE